MFPLQWTKNRIIGKVAMSEKRACSSFRDTDNSSKWIQKQVVADAKRDLGTGLAVSALG
jgi:hypothetical protein